MTHKEVWISQAGLEALKRRRAALRDEIDAVQGHMGESASRDNDLRENPEFMQLRTRLQYQIPTELARLDEVIKNARVIEEAPEYEGRDADVVWLGDAVQIRSGMIEEEYVLVGWGEADVSASHVSYLSPLGSALLGSKVGTTIRYETPSGSEEIEILSRKRALPG